MVNTRLDIDALVAGELSIGDYNNSGFVQSPPNKQMPHPTRYFKELFLPPVNICNPENGRFIENSSIVENLFSDFLEGKIKVTIPLAKKLESATNMPYDFWLRAQYRHDNFI